MGDLEVTNPVYIMEITSLDPLVVFFYQVWYHCAVFTNVEFGSLLFLREP